MSSRKKASSEVYVPPGRRSEGGSSNGGTPLKKEAPETDDVVPPNCCDDEEERETKYQNLEQQFGAIAIGSSSSSNWRSQMNPTGLSKEFQEMNIARRSAGKTDLLQKSTRRLGGSKNQDNEQDVTSSGDIIDYFLQLNVPYIDSHCHTDYMYTSLARRKTNSNEGLLDWIEKYPRAFPKCFFGLIANFIKPDLFVDVKGNSSYDVEWIVKELASPLYLGTTWGCHPHFAQHWGRMGVFWTTMEYILSDAEEWKVLAVGECGIDLHRCESELEVQKDVFEKHVALAFKFKLPLVIHCRNGSKGRAEEECLQILKKKMDVNHKFLKIHRHCFTENWEVAQMWLKQCPDVHFGFTPAVFTMGAPQIQAIRNIPLDRILLETDGPYFKPKCYDGVAPPKVCLPGMAIATASKIAEIKNLPIEEVLRATFNNTRRVYQLPVY